MCRRLRTHLCMLPALKRAKQFLPSETQLWFFLTIQVIVSIRIDWCTGHTTPTRYIYPTQQKAHMTTTMEFRTDAATRYERRVVVSFFYILFFFSFLVTCGIVQKKPAISMRHRRTIISTYFHQSRKQRWLLAFYSRPISNYMTFLQFAYIPI